MGVMAILVSTIFVNNYVFAQFLGICPFLGVLIALFNVVRKKQDQKEQQALYKAEMK